MSHACCGFVVVLQLRRELADKRTRLVEMKRTREQFAVRQADCEQALQLLRDIEQLSHTEK